MSAFSGQLPKVSTRSVREATKATANNERITRDRVDRLEAWAGTTTRMTVDLMDFTQMPFLERLRWLLTGTLPSRPEPTIPRVTESL